ncbi:hypothetical protein [Paenibacillus sp. FSL R7-0333]|uniref:hypothetical protein n=1 Tax=Paenibacillus sp. FSL R7-0333 TaxID=1926587 RepID=UPI00096D2639|nr:hypothetical protein BK146_16575 [Paenibacillus sp. FSL R7-0333]
MGKHDDQIDALVHGLHRVEARAPAIIDEYHDHPRPGYVVPAWSQEQGGYFIQVPPIQQSDDDISLECRWLKRDIYSALGVPTEILETVKANEREFEEMYREWLRSNPVIRKVGQHEHSTGQ